ncbi:MAG: class IV adenylate cyclase [Ferruginibacter sp.]
MAHLNVEFKATAKNIQLLEEKLETLNPVFKGEDHQVDTYFDVSTGRLKLREGNIENALIWYERENTAGSKQSHILLYKHEADKTLKEILIKTHGIKVVVDKRRRIYFIDNVKFHFDKVKDLGTFIEVEAIDADGSLGLEKITEQCNYYAAFFEIKKEDFQSLSYSDMLLK